ncbi:MAG: DUF448 domain-containing protein [Polyangiales bacterium]
MSAASAHSVPKKVCLHSQERRCVGCRNADARDALLRFVAGPDGRVHVDLRRRLPGRGASVHARAACLRAAVKSGGLARALRVPGPLSVDALVPRIRTQLWTRWQGLWTAARASRSVALGAAATMQALHDTTAHLVVFAVDAGSVARRVQQRCAAAQVPCRTVMAKVDFGAATDRSQLAVAAVTHPQLAEVLIRVCDQLQALVEET